ncbi:hypothetical protein M2277_005049 [Paenibacillus sp. LBL]|uniref:hypothetical protein n=1 Tax=Paenibacillus sp. LBL TaxID=2940563 RepID=UPI00247701FD|nr:hypothetical protein [Paenibacillus sp. LBL]MDH6674357.1 hypothetical protein [Paenibacillus sp. LBL]
MEGFKLVTVPNRDKEGWLHGTKSILVKWNCPVCGEEMGTPEVKQFCEDGEFYSVDTWTNKCGHIAKYSDLEVHK